MPMGNPFLDRLRRGPILADGAMGTQLYARGISFERGFDELNLLNPALVQEIRKASSGKSVITVSPISSSRGALTT
jgi:methionine synthase I (cobalamin-dependent)